MRFSGSLLAAALLVSACSSAPPPSPAPVGPPPPKPPEPLACAAGSADCDGDRGNACETQLDSSAKHCGACGATCAEGETCAMGACKRAAILSAADEHACVVLADGKVRCWGDNEEGQLGDGTTSVRSTAVDVIGVSGAVGVRAGQSHSCAVLATGRVACWGDEETPKNAAGFEDAMDAIVRDREICVVRRSGEVACADLSFVEPKEKGEEGEEESEDDKPTVRSIAGVKGAISIVAGRNHTCALMRSGEVACWGDADALGAGAPPENEEEGDSDAPRAKRVKGLNDAVQIASHGYHTCAVRKTGQIACWGGNYAGQLGDGGSDEKTEPVSVQFVSDAVEVATGLYHTCAVRKTGEVACWGEGGDGELGHGVRESSRGPVTVKGLTDATNVMAGKEFTCARRKSGEVACWGSARRGKLGNGSTAEHSAPVEVSGVTDATHVALGANHSCALRRDGSATCWGLGYYSGSGDGYRARGIPPALVKDLTEIVDLRSSDRYGCALKKSGEVYCFRGGVPAYVETEVQENARWLPSVAKGLAPAKAAVAYGYMGVALLRTGQAVLWNSEAMGIGSTSSAKTTPITSIPIAGVLDGIDIATMDSAACVLRRSGQISCLRYAMFNTFDKKSPTKPGAVTLIPDIKDAVQMSAGGTEFCAVRKTGEVACFNYYDLPSPVRPNEKPAQPAKKPPAPAKKEPPRPLKVRTTEGIADATMVAVGSSFQCALLKSGEIACRGSNDEGQLGNGEHEWSGQPVLVKGISDAVYVAAASSHACAVRKSGRVACWGNNEQDQVGHKDAAVFLQPTAVKGLP